MIKNRKGIPLQTHRLYTLIKGEYNKGTLNARGAKRLQKSKEAEISKRFEELFF